MTSPIRYSQIPYDPDKQSGYDVNCVYEFNLNLEDIDDSTDEGLLKEKLAIETCNSGGGYVAKSRIIIGFSHISEEFGVVPRYVVRTRWGRIASDTYRWNNWVDTLFE